MKKLSNVKLIFIWRKVVLTPAGNVKIKSLSQHQQSHLAGN
jgi:hypothetical protein